MAMTLSGRSLPGHSATRDWQCINTTTVPENYTGVVRQMHPDVLILLDAADMREEPGTLRRLDPDAIQSGDFGTHAGSLGQIARYLSDCAGEVIILGIQPLLHAPGRPAFPPCSRSPPGAWPRPARKLDPLES